MTSNRLYTKKHFQIFDPHKDQTMHTINIKFEDYVNANACVCMIGVILKCCVAFWLLYLP